MQQYAECPCSGMHFHHRPPPPTTTRTRKSWPCLSVPCPLLGSPPQYMPCMVTDVIARLSLSLALPTHTTSTQVIPTNALIRQLMSLATRRHKPDKFSMFLFCMSSSPCFLSNDEEGSSLHR